MKKLVFMMSLMLVGVSSQASNQAICAVKSSVGDTNVTVELKDDYRYQVGLAHFSINGIQGMIEVVTWLGKGGRVADNTYELAGVKVANADMQVNLQMDSFSVSVDCKLKE